MAKVFNAPQKTPEISSGFRHLFLAGSIDMGTAVDWQSQVIEALKDDDRWVIYNPRRSDWDSSWVQSIDNPQFKEQVTWELDHLDKSDVICFVFDPKGLAPITLLELGLHANSFNCDVVVCCPDGYWRKGNVDVVCEQYGLDQVDSVEALIDYLKELV